MQLRKCRFFSVARGFQLDNGVTSPGYLRMHVRKFPTILCAFGANGYVGDIWTSVQKSLDGILETPKVDWSLDIHKKQLHSRIQSFKILSWLGLISKGMVGNQACRVFYFLQFTIRCWCIGLLGVNEKLHSFFLLSYRLLCLIYIETVVEGGIFTRIVYHN